MQRRVAVIEGRWTQTSQRTLTLILPCILCLLMLALIGVLFSASGGHKALDVGSHGANAPREIVNVIGSTGA
jgi:hypothetical protein